MENHVSAFPWVPEYEDGFSPSSAGDQVGLLGRGFVVIANLFFYSVELYLTFFFTSVVTVLLVAQ
tara:strand:- start:307 stop:501 length:195 start_codon:yes stop_codon:yes gene_type:complete